MRRETVIKHCILSVFLIFAALFIWPTRYRYDHIHRGTMTLPIRIDRFTGKTEALYLDAGWTNVASSETTGN